MFKNELLLVPKKPGCYKMINSKGIIIYIGKAKNLQNRLRSYFNGRVTGKTMLMVSEVDHFEYIVTSSETESFILELNLIKENSPKYNILLKDDKSYPYIELTKEKFPRLLVKRDLNIKKNKSNIFGPFPNAYAARKLVRILNRLYPLKKCVNMPKKVCLYYHINQCLGYCENPDVDTTNIISEIKSILLGNNNLLKERLNTKLEEFSNNMQYEEAKEIKEEIDYISQTYKDQKVEINSSYPIDMFAYYEKDGFISIEIFFIRNGKLLGNDYRVKPIISDSINELETFIMDFYSSKNVLPKEVIVPSELNIKSLSEILQISCISVYKGKKNKLMNMCYENAKITYENKKTLISMNSDKNYNANKELKELLKLDVLSTIEVFDISNLFGTFTVAGMVVFVDGSPSSKDYRKFKINEEVNDDVFSMHEVIYRRYYRLLMQNSPLPDLIVVDGKINQINAAKKALEELSLNIPIIGIFKDHTHSATSVIDGRNYENLNIDKTSSLFHYITRISDEVHRYTINYHKTIRNASSIKSVLDNIEGIGAKRKKILINKFGSIKKIKELPIEELSKYIPYKSASLLLDYLRYNDKGEEK